MKDSDDLRETLKKRLYFVAANQELISDIHLEVAELLDIVDLLVEAHYQPQAAGDGELQPHSAEYRAGHLAAIEELLKVAEPDNFLDIDDVRMFQKGQRMAQECIERQHPND